MLKINGFAVFYWLQTLSAVSPLIYQACRARYTLLYLLSREVCFKFIETFAKALLRLFLLFEKFTQTVYYTTIAYAPYPGAERKTRLLNM